jgi:hypothetical protein
MKNIFSLFVGVFTLSGKYSQYAMVNRGGNFTKIVGSFSFNIEQIYYTTFNHISQGVRKPFELYKIQF